MKQLIKTFLALTLSVTLFAENETEPAPAVVETPAQPTIEIAQPESATESNATVQENAPTSDIATTTDETAPSEATMEAEEPLEDIRDIRPAVDLPVETWQIVAISSIILILLVILLYFLRKHHKNKQAISIIPIDPYHKALQELESALQLIQRLDQRPFATGITDAVRGYLAAVFDLPAPECTTEEVLEQLPNVALLTEEIRQNITHLLQQCDLAKFTKLQFDQPDRLKLYSQAKEFIQGADKLIQLQNTNTPEQ